MARRECRQILCRWDLMMFARRVMEQEASEVSLGRRCGGPSLVWMRSGLALDSALLVAHMDKQTVCFLRCVFPMGLR